MRTESLSVDAFSVLAIERLDVGFVPRPWRFADERRGEIDAYFAEMQRRNPALWNGRVLLLGDFAVGLGFEEGAQGLFIADVADLNGGDRDAKVGHLCREHGLGLLLLVAALLDVVKCANALGVRDAADLRAVHPRCHAQISRRGPHRAARRRNR